MRWQMILAVVVLGIPVVGRAQPLAERIPGDAILYVGWQGGEGVGSGYEKSHLKAVLDSSNLPQVFNSVVPQAIARVGRENPQAGQILTMVSAIGAPMWRHPTALYFGPVDFKAAGGPRPKVALLCNAGKDAESLLKQFDGVAMQLAGAPFPVKTFRQGDLVVMSVGFETEAEAVVGAADAGKSLVGSASFKQAIGQVNKEPVAIAYVDVEGVLKQVAQAAELQGGAEAAGNLAKVIGALGADGVKRIVWTGGFDGADWSTQCFVAAPAPRSGLVTMMDAKPVSDETLKAIPKTAAWMAVGQFDLAKFSAELRTAAGKVDPQAQQGFDMAMGVAQMALVMNIQKDLFEPLGSEWALYSDPATGGAGFAGLTMVNRLTRPDDAQRALGKLELFIDNAVNGQLAREKMRVSFEQTKVGDANIHYVQLPLVAPSWTIKSGNLYAALYPQTIAAASAQASGSSSILDNADFVAMRKRLGGEKATGISYTDLPRSVEQGYQLWLMGSQLAMGAADIFGIKTPPMVIPPLSKLKEHLSPAGSISWTDDAGWHVKSISPFPCAEVLGSPGGIVTTAAPLVGAGLGTFRAHAAPRAVHVGQ